jgi:hypothetical protein
VNEALESSIVRVDKYYRVVIPQAIGQRAGWVAGDQPLNAWILLGDCGRCRLMSAPQVEADTSLQSLRARIALEVDERTPNPVEFQDKVSLALALRLLPVQVTPPPPAWRLALPRPIAAIMGIRPGESDVALLFFHGHIELWTIETLRSAVATPLTDFI